MTKIVPLIYPGETVKTIPDLGLDEKQYICENRGSFSYEGNSGHSEPTLVISPYYDLTVNGHSIPVYATVIYLGIEESCALHSYAIIEVEEVGDLRLTASLTAKRYPLKNAVILPECLKTKPLIVGNSANVEITGYGDYSFILNDEKDTVSQQNAFTLFVRKYRDEEAEIEAYQKEYGDDRVKVYPAGTHYIDYIHVDHSDSVMYLRRGSLLIAKGRPGYGEQAQYVEADAKDSNGWGLDRNPLIAIHRKTNIRIVGNGTVDAGQLGWHERRGLLASFCSKIEISGLTFLNFPEWTLITYCCTDVDIHDTRIFGYKTNSDGFAICNSSNTTVQGCYSRSGDDLFEIKTFRGVGPDSASHNVTFTDCIAWASKARCFGIIAELYQDVSDILFRDCAVIFRDAIWDNDILGSLVVICSEGNGKITDITFENIEIYYDYGHAVALVNTDENQTGRQVQNIVFKNVSYRAALPMLLRARGTGTNKIETVFENVTGNGSFLSEATIGNMVDSDLQSFVSYGKENKI